MIKINERSLGLPHTLYANKDLKSMGEVWKKGEMKTSCLVQFMSDGRVSVMGGFNDYFYKVFANLEEVHHTFNEQMTIQQAAA